MTLRAHLPQLRRVARRHPLPIAVLVLALVLTLFFAVRLTISAIYWQGHRDQVIAPWMTVGYIGRSYQLDPRSIDATAGLPHPPRHGHPWTMEQIADMRGVPVDQVIAEVRDAIARLRAERGAERK